MKPVISWGNKLLIPRWFVTIMYALFIPIGVTVFLASSPSLDLTTGAGYTALWAMILGATGLCAAIASLSPTWEVLERWSALILSALLIGYAFAPIQLVIHGDTDKAAFSVISLVLAFPVVSQTIRLITRTGARKDV
jgi:hypothetical protein